MVARYSLALALLPVVGCSPAKQQEPAAEPPVAASEASEGQVTDAVPEAPPANALSAGELPGEYRVAGVDGGDINLPYGISASIDGRRIHVVADCVNAAWRYTYAGGRLATTRVPTESCARGLTTEEEAIVAALDSATQAARTPANGIALSGRRAQRDAVLAIATPLR